MVHTSAAWEYVRHRWQWLRFRSSKLLCSLLILFTLGEYLYGLNLGFGYNLFLLIKLCYLLCFSEDPHNYKQLGENTNGPAATLFIYNPFRRYEVMIFFALRYYSKILKQRYNSNESLCLFDCLGLAFHHIYVCTRWTNAHYDEFDHSDFLGCCAWIGSSLVARCIGLFSWRFSRFNGNVHCQSKNFLSWGVWWGLCIDNGTYRNHYHGK